MSHNRPKKIETYIWESRDGAKVPVTISINGDTLSASCKSPSWT